MLTRAGGRIHREDDAPGARASYRGRVTRSGTPTRWLDPLLAGLLTVLGQAELWGGAVVGGERWAVGPVMAIGTASVAFRRVAPLPVVVAAFGSMAVQGLLGVDSDTAFAPLLAAFLAIGSAAYHARRPVVAVVVAVLLIWPVILLDKGLSPGDLAYAALLVGLAWSVGRGFGVGRLRAQLAEQRANAVAAEQRLQVARELHDVLGHSISVMTLHAGGARRLLRPDQQPQREALETVERTGRQALDDLARVLEALRTPGDHPLDAQPGLARAEELLASARSAGLSARLDVDGSPRALPAGVDVSLYRILQEALTNVLKHARATRVDVRVRYDADAVRLEVTDDGAALGSSPDGADGHGLLGMRERAALYGGTLDSGRLPDRGYRVAATIPLPAEAR